MTESEKQSIIDAVLSALRTNSQTIEQLTPVVSLSPVDYFEVNGGRRIAYSDLATLISTITQNLMQTEIYNKEIQSVEITTTETSALLTIKCAGKTVQCPIPTVSTSKSGFFTANDKAGLDSAYETLRSFTERLGKFIVAGFDGFADTVSELGSAVDEIDEMRPGYEVCYVRDINRFVYCDKVTGGSEFTFKWPQSYLYNRADGQARTDVIYLYGTNQFYHKTSGGLFRLADLKDISDASAQAEQKLTQTKGELTESLNSRIADVLERLASTDSSAAETRALVSQLKTALETLTSGNVTEAIDNYNEIIRFLDGFRDDESLAPILKEIRDELERVSQYANEAWKYAESLDHTFTEDVNRLTAGLSGIGVAPFAGFCDDPRDIQWMDRKLTVSDGFHIGFDRINKKFFGVLHTGDYAHCEAGDGSYDFEGDELYKDYDGHPRRDVLYRESNDLYHYTSNGLVRFIDSAELSSEFFQARQYAQEAWNYAESIDHSLSESISENSDNIRSAVTRIAGLENRTQSQASDIETLRTALDTLTSGNVTDAIESFNEIVRFLNGFKDNEELAPIIKEIKDAVDSFRARLGEFSVLPFSGFADSLADYGGMDAGRIEDTTGWHVCYLHQEDRFVLVCHDDTYPHCSGGDYTSDWPGASLYNGADGKARRDAFYLYGTNQLYHRTDEGMSRLADMNDLGGVENKVTANADAISGFRTQFPNKGYIKTATGVIHSDDHWGYSDLIPLDRESDIELELRHSSSVDGGVFFYDAAGNFISGLQREAYVPSSVPVSEFPANARFFRVCTYGLANAWFRNGKEYCNFMNVLGNLIRAVQDAEYAAFVKKWQTVYTYSASYNPAQEKPFIMNGVAMSHEEALIVDRWGSLAEFRNCGSSSFWGAIKNLPKLRTTVPSYCHDLGSPDEYPELCWVNESLEVVKFAINATTWQRFVLSRDIGLYSGKVRAINDILEPTKAVRIGLVENDTLEKLYIYRLKYNLDLRYLRAVSLETLSYLVANSANGSNTITVTVNSSIFEKMTREEDWVKLAEDAAAKNISFATV